MAVADGSLHNVVCLFTDDRIPLMYSLLFTVPERKTGSQLTLYPLRHALEQNGKEQIDLLLASGENINFMWTARLTWNMRRSVKATPMCRYLIEFVADSSSLEMVKFLLDRGARLDISYTLHAAESNSTEEDQTERVNIIEFLLEQGMDINKLEFAGEEDLTSQYWGRAYGTPLQYAVSWGLPKIVECLLKNGADPNIQAFSSKRKVDYGTALDWQKTNETDKGMYNQ